MDPKVTCTNTITLPNGKKTMCHVMMDEMCLIGRYGETVEEVFEFIFMLLFSDCACVRACVKCHVSAALTLFSGPFNRSVEVSQM